MSAMTAKLIAAESLAKTKNSMLGTPASWLSSLDEEAHLRRYSQTLRYLQTCYGRALHALPPYLGEGKKEELQKLLDRLDGFCSMQVRKIGEILNEAQTHLDSVPKFYYSELRFRLNCMLPEAPSTLTEASAINFFGAEAIACLRGAERFALLAKERGDAAVAAEAWRVMGEDASKIANDIVSTMIRVFGEERAEASLRLCTKEEQLVCGEMLDGSKGRMRFGGGTSFADVGDDEEEEDDDEGDGDYCSVLTKPIFVVSDCTGESAEKTVQCSLGQFGHCFDRSCPADITTFRFCTAGMIEAIVEQAKARKAFIVFTLVDPITNLKMVETCDEFGVEHHDLWSPLLEKLEGYLDTTRQGVPGRRQFADEDYMNLVDCIEYTRTLDDGVQPQRWKEADIMILGPSRSGKTPLAFFMAQRGYKVANYPLVPGEDIPKELWEFDQRRVFALDIDPKKLTSIRDNRMKTLRMGSKTSYAEMGKVREEVEWCKRLYRNNSHWTILDTSDTGIEETSARILQVIDVQGGLPGMRISDNPSAI